MWGPTSHASNEAERLRRSLRVVDVEVDREIERVAGRGVGEPQGLLFEGPDPEGARLIDGLMGAVDRVNRRFGKRSVTFAAEGTRAEGTRVEEGETETGHPWAMRRQMKSPAYTTRWGDLPEARLE